MTGAAIDLAPARRPRLRRARTAAGWVHLALTMLIVAGVFTQVYLIGAYIFGAGQEALDAHRSLGFTIHGLEVLVFVAALLAWLPRADVVLSLLLAVVGTGQIVLAESQGGRVASIPSVPSSCSRSRPFWHSAAFAGNGCMGRSPVLCGSVRAACVDVELAGAEPA